ncbi:hypothetical protein Cni_G22499 [Canna indica]|uniref:Uncharacterized protein n=1 Tax=Canna indica TaxID=4628 RepID=A0AAQ3KWT8_9LILI|nr:hypothetical protein Cni_G22499 [Canna indica]
MSDWRLTAASTVYTDALKATESLSQPAVGFVNPTVTTNKVSESLFRQLNTLIQITVQIKEQLEDLKAEVQAIKKEKEKPNVDLTTSIDSLAKDLQKLKIGDKPTIPKLQGKLYVYKDPKKIFEQEKEKAKHR